jgi:polyhydroxybutyrate depolymerase
VRLPPALALALALGCAGARLDPSDTALAPGDHPRRLEHGGRERSYVLHVPRGDPARLLPLVLAFHGGGGNGPGFQRYAGLDALAERDGFLVAYPNGSHRWRDDRLLTWNAGGCCGYARRAEVDDVGFALALIEDVARAARLDPARVYATGHSNGSMMAYRLAAEASPRIAAVAGVAGAMTLAAFAPLRPVPVLHVHSADDPRAPYAGGTRRTFGNEIVHLHVEAQLERWRERDGCTETSEVRDRRTWAGSDNETHTATLRVWAACADGTEVALWRLTGAGHGWPGGDTGLPERIVGPRTGVISAADEVWDFLRRFSLGSPRPG